MSYELRVPEQRGFGSLFIEGSASGDDHSAKTPAGQYRDITGSATILQDSEDLTIVKINGKTYFFTPLENQDGTPTGGGANAGSEKVLLNGKVGFIEPAEPDEPLVTVRTAAQTTTTPTVTVRTTAQTTTTTSSTRTAGSEFPAQQLNSFDTNIPAVHALWSLVKNSNLVNKGENVNGISLVSTGGQSLIEQSNLPPAQKTLAIELLKEIRQQIWDEAIYMLIGGMPDSVQNEIRKHINFDDYLTIGTFSFNNIHNRAGTTGENALPANKWHFDDAFINTVTALDPDIVSPNSNYSQEQTLVMPWQSSNDPTGYALGSAKTPPNDQTTMFYGTRAEDGMFAAPLFHKVPETTNQNRWVLTVGVQADPTKPDFFARLGILRLAHESGAFKNSPRHLAKLANDLFTPKTNGREFANDIKTTLLNSFPTEKAKKQFAAFIQDRPECFARAYRIAQSGNPKIQPTKLRQDITKWANEWNPIQRPGPKVTEDIKFNKENGAVESRTIKKNGAEVLKQQFDLNGNLTLETKTFYKRRTLNSDNPIPVRSVTTDATGQITSRTTFKNGEPVRRSDYTYGSANDFKGDMKLPAGNYKKETVSVFVDGKPVKQKTNLYDADNKLMQVENYNEQGRKTSRIEYTYNAQGRKISERVDKTTPLGKLSSLTTFEHDIKGEIISKSETQQLGSTPPSTTTTKYYEGKKIGEIVLANGKETTSTYNPHTGKLDGTGNSVNGQWHGPVQFIDDTGALSKIVVYKNGVEGDYYNRATNSLHGINIHGVMSTEDLQSFDQIINSMRERGYIGFLGHPSSDKYRPLIETLDFVQAVGLPSSSIKNFDLTKPKDFTLDTNALKNWVSQLERLDSNALTPSAKSAIQDFKQYLNISALKGSLVNGTRTMGWFLTNVLAGDLGDIASLGQDLFKFAQNFSSSRIMGKSASQLTPDVVSKSISQTTGTGATKGMSIGKILGPVATVVFLGVSMYSGIKGFKEAKQEGASKVELAYWAFSAIGGGPGGAICAAIDAKRRGADKSEVTAAFFAGLFGAYTPGERFIGSFKADKLDRNTRVDSRMTLEAINIPPNGRDPGFNSDRYNLPGGTDLYNGRYDPALEDAFLDYMKSFRPNSPNYVPRVEGMNGQYVTSDYFGGDSYFEGEQWVWYDGQMPLYGVKEGARQPITSLDDLKIVGWANHPTPTPQLVSTPEDDDEYTGSF